MKLIYFSSECFDNTSNYGVTNKIISQISCIKSILEEVFLYYYKDEDLVIQHNECCRIIGKKKNKVLNKFYQYKDINEFIKQEKIDIIYIRFYGFSDIFFINFLKTLRGIVKKIYIEIPTYPYDYEKNKLTYGYTMDKIFRRYLHKYVDKVVTFSYDSMIFDIPCINISNGIDLKAIRVRSSNINTNINVIAVANFSFWHGYDRFINGMNEYYKNGGTKKIYLHMVGEGKELDSYKILANKYNLNDFIIFYGSKIGKELDEIYDKCDIALDAMGRHRSDVYYNSSLKGKEYLAKGIPIISGVKTEVDYYIGDFKYYTRVPANDNYIDMIDVIKFYNDIYLNEDKILIINNIRNFAESHFDIKISMKNLLDDITSINNQEDN